MMDRLAELKARLQEQRRADEEEERRRPVAPVRSAIDERRAALRASVTANAEHQAAAEVKTLDVHRRMERLNELFSQRSAAIEKFKATMGTVRNAVNKEAWLTRNEGILTRAKLVSEAAFERDAEKRKALHEEATAYGHQVEAIEIVINQNTKAGEEALEEMRQEVAEIDKQIEAIGGSVKLRPEVVAP